MRTVNFDNIKASKVWSFENVRSTDQWTHGYHRYPAKFLPNVVKKLIENYASIDFVIADLFAGCGTTLVEAKAHGIQSVGTDINPIATLITRVKTTPIEPQRLETTYNNIVSSFDSFREEEYVNLHVHERLDYWFRQEEKYKIAHLYLQVNNIEDCALREFFLVAISHILKNCSWWLQSSTKPQRDLAKNILNPFDAFKQHCAHMMKGNFQFYKQLSEKGQMNVGCQINQEDARHTTITDNSIDIVITSPPYVTSYEYADIHQLTGYWMEYFSDIRAFRKLFIGTSYSGTKETVKSNSILGDSIIDALSKKNKRIANDVSNYFNDMNAVAKEMYRIIKSNGYACIVIGNTTLRDIRIKSAEVFYDFLKKAGFKKVKVIKRNIPNKLMPTLRDKITGKFTTLSNQDCKKVYPDEYIIIVKK